MVKRIKWDKGHGGIDPGAMGNDLQEKVLNHKIVEYAMDYLSANYTGFEQSTTRSGDQTLSLNQRTDQANTEDADILVSVHINSFSSTSKGFETFIYNGGVGDETIAFQNVLHEEILAAMKKFGEIVDRGKKRANLHMVRESKMIACLTENLFISNAGDARLLKNEKFLKAVGEAHARGVAKFLGLKAKRDNKQANTAVEKTSSVKIQTGGLNAEMIKDISDFFILNKWYAEITFNFKSGNPTAMTGGLSAATRDKFEAWLKERGWWYRVVK